jgi:hypothetical protein
LILGAHSTTGHTAAEENTLSRIRICQGEKKIGEFFGSKCSPSKIAPGPEGAIKTIPFANRGQKSLEEHDLLAAWHLGRLYANVLLAFGNEWRQPMRFFGWLKGHLAGKCLKFIDGIHKHIIEHIFYIVNHLSCIDYFRDRFSLVKITFLIWIKFIDLYEDSPSANKFYFSKNPYRTYNSPPYRHEV